MAMTDFSNIINILGTLYFQYRDEEAFADFIEYNDIGLPIAYLTSEDLCGPSPEGEKYVMETWQLFLTALEVDDQGFTSLEELLDIAAKKGKEEK